MYNATQDAALSSARPSPMFCARLWLPCGVTRKFSKSVKSSLAFDAGVFVVVVDDDDGDDSAAAAGPAYAASFANTN